ncbi:hypothetical protein V5740_12875 [Croceibacterium sp. TMG7-5b_MA50]
MTLPEIDMNLSIRHTGAALAALLIATIALLPASAAQPLLAAAPLLA